MVASKAILRQFCLEVGGKTMNFFISLVVAGVLAASSAVAQSVTARDGGPSASEMTARSSAGAPDAGF